MFDFRDVAQLRSACYEIHAFGLGFIQIKLTPSSRFHLYTREVKQTTEPEDVHDHRYGFMSTVLQGSLQNTLWSVSEDPQGEFLVSGVTCKKGESGEQRPLFACRLDKLAQFTLGPGGVYSLERDAFHQVEALQEGTITWLRRELPTKDLARVARRKDSSPVCPFSANTWTDDELWNIYEKAVEGVANADI